MILVDIPARMACDEDGCTAVVAVQLCLTMGGGFVFRPPATGKWQLNPARNGTIGVRCEKHHQSVQVAPVVPTLDLSGLGPKGGH